MIIKNPKAKRTAIMSSPPGVEHTIDNLCKPEKGKVVEMLKQLNELRKRCTVLEGLIETAHREEQHILSREAEIVQQIEDTEEKAVEATDLSRVAQDTIRGISTSLQNSETENQNLKSRLVDTKEETETMVDILRQLSIRYDRIHVDTAVLCLPDRVEVAENTVDERSMRDAETQLQNRVLSTTAFEETEDVPWDSVCDDADDDVRALIDLLNKQ